MKLHDKKVISIKAFIGTYIEYFEILGDFWVANLYY